MFTRFVCDGSVVLERDIDYIPDNEDRIKICHDFYIVNDRTFIFAKRDSDNEARIYLTKISK